MGEIERLKQYILKRVAMTPEELHQLASAFKIALIKKNQFIVQPDFTVKRCTFVVEGSFRSFIIDESGVDHTIQFALEDWWISDYNSYIYQKPATMFVVALENSTVLQLEFEKEQELMKANQKFETFFRIGAERMAAFHQRRIISSLTMTAEERYNDFLEKHPAAALRLPQHAMASYLGMSREFLSKIRNHRVRKK